MRVGILGLLQESNTFLPERTTWKDFANETLARRSEILDLFRDAPHEIGGFLAGLESAGIEPVPLFVARALPYGTIEANSFSSLMEAMFDELALESELDGLLVAAHGATVSDDYPDADGHWLARVRNVVGAQTPIIGTLDPHANLSPAMIDACDALIAYRTNPHMDQRERGVEAAEVLRKTLAGNLQPTMAAAFPSLAMSIECQCTDDLPCRELIRIADETLEHPAVVSNSLLLGFPYADVREMGTSVIVVTDGDDALASQLAGELANAVWQQRERLVAAPVSVEAAVRQASKAKAPVCLLDMGDNVGGGAPADGTWLAHALAKSANQKSLITLCDRDAVVRARKAGVGLQLQLSVGGKSGDLSGRPFVGEFKVKSIHNGKFTESQPRHGGYRSFDQGETAILESPLGLTVVATSRRIVPFSLAQLTSCGIDASSYGILVAKGVNAPIAAYREVCNEFIRVNTPGYTSADMTSLHFKQRRRPMFPFEKETQWSPSSKPT